MADRTVSAECDASEKHAPRLLRRSAIAAATLVVALLVRLSLDEFFGDAAPYAVFYLAFVFIVRFAGLGPSVFAIIAILLLVDYFFTPPRHEFGFSSTGEWINAVIFTFVCSSLLFFWTNEQNARWRERQALQALEKQTQELSEAREALARSMAELEQRVRERTQSLQETTDQLNAFCYSVAHDLQAPLRAQAGMARLLLEECGAALGPTGTDYVQRIAEAAGRQSELVQDLLAHLSVSRADLPLEALSLAKSIAEACADFKQQIKRLQGVIQVEPTPAKVLANSASLHLVLTNLLSNALKFVASGIRPQVRLWTEPHDGFVRLWVADNGIGIDPKYMGKLFGVFQRLHPSQQYPGTGIGLAIVKRAVERMGGKVGVDSDPAKGSRFWVELKAAN